MTGGEQARGGVSGNAAGALAIGVLGPLDVSVGGRPVVLAGRLRTLVAVLAISVGKPASVERLADATWGEALPDNAKSAVQTYIVRLRRALGYDAIHTAAAGYTLRIARDRVDALLFEQLLDAAAVAPDASSRRAGLIEALALWRGVPFEDTRSAWLREVEAPRLVERYLDALELRIDLDLAGGCHGGLVAELGNLTARYPLRERFWELLMLAQYRSGRQADALDTYRRLHQLLADEVGIGPGTSARELHRRILAVDGSLDPPAGLATVEPAVNKPAASIGPGLPAERAASPDELDRSSAVLSAAPAQLPADVSAFTGRDVELAQLDALLTSLDPLPADLERVGPRDDGPAAALDSTAVSISTVSGTAGVGKTALAVRWAHQIRDRFPDGQLYVNLRGYDPDQPVDPGEALARFLSALGVPGAQIPLELDERAARYRTVTAGKRLLIMLDNASSVEQVRPLLPGTASCVVVVTSRDSLAGLVAVHGAHRIDLDLLPPAEALTLLRRLIGRRVEAEQDAAATLAAQCARLPLALRVAAELAVSRPTAPLVDLVADLTNEQRRLDLLDAGGDPRAAVAAVFSWSVRQLPADAARTFGLLGLHPGPDFDTYAAAALTGQSLDQVQRWVDRLARGHLIHPTRKGRHGMHDLLRAYAVALASTEGTNSASNASLALDRLFDYYLAAAATAMERLYPAEAQHRPRGRMPAADLPVMADPHAALTWLNTELPCLVATVAHTDLHGRSTHTIRLSTTLFRYLDGGHFADAMNVHCHGYHAAVQVGDLTGQADTMWSLGVAHRRLGRPGSASTLLLQALALYRQTSNRIGEARTLNVLGLINRLLGNYAAAADYYESSLALWRQVGDAVGQGYALDCLGLLARRLGDYSSAAEHHEQALALFRQVGDQVGEASALDSLGHLAQLLGRYETSVDYHRHALSLFRIVGYQSGEAYELTGLAMAYLRLGRIAQAIESHEHALAIFRAVGDRQGEGWTLNGAGDAAYAAGKPDDALARYTAALALAADIGDRDQQARAHTGLGQAHRALGQITRARTHYTLAMDLYTELGVSEAADVRSHLELLTHVGCEAAPADEGAAEFEECFVDVVADLPADA